MRISFGLRTFLVAVGVAVLAYLGTYLIKPRYAASESLFFPLSQDPMTPVGSRPGGAGSQDGGVTYLEGALNAPLVGARIQTAIGIIESRSCAKYLVSAMDLAQHYGLPADKAAYLVGERLRTETDKNGFLKIEFEDEDKSLAKAVLADVQTYLNEMSEKLSINVSKKNRLFVQSRLDEARSDLAAVRKKLSKKMGDNPAANPDLLQRNLFVARGDLEEAQNKVVSARAQIASTEHYVKAILAQADSFPGRLVVLNAVYGNISALTEDLQKRRLALADAAALYRSNDPELAAIEQTEKNANSIVSDLVNEQKGDVEHGIAPALATAKSNLASLEAETTDYAALVQRLADEYVQTVKDSSSIDSIRRELGSAEARVTRLEGEQELSMIAEFRNPDRFQVVDAPEASGEVAYPKRSIIAFVAFTLALGIQLVLLKDEQKRFAEDNGATQPRMSA